MDLYYRFELLSRLLLEELSDFQPQVELRDVYKFNETAMSLPDKEGELKRIRSRKAFDSNVMERIKVESSSHEEEEDDDEDARIAELAANAKKNFTIWCESKTADIDGEGEDILGKSDYHKGGRIVRDEEGMIHW